MSNYIGDPTPTAEYFNAIDEVAHLRVTALQPPTSTVDGMDFERCAALHNAIVRHAWTASGYLANDIPQTTWWQYFSSAERINQIDMEEFSESLDSSVRGFLERVLYLTHYSERPNTASFLAHLPGLNPPYEMFVSFQDAREADPDGIYAYTITLYHKHESLGSDFFDGIVYDQGLHGCFYSQFDPTDLLDAGAVQTVPWQPLETILSVYIDMIRSGKLVALNRFVSEHDLPGNLRHDPQTGVVRDGIIVNPWVTVPYTAKDVEETVVAWGQLVESVEARMPSRPTGLIEYGLCHEESMLAAGVKESSFLWHILLRLRKPRFLYLGPGLRLPTSDEFAEQPFAAARVCPPSEAIYESRESYHLPFLLLQSTDSVNCWGIDLYGNIPSQVPCGLYLDFSKPLNSVCPFENGCRLLVPAKSGMTHKAFDGSVVSMSDGVYQIGHDNPFLPEHSTPLAVVLRFFNKNVQTGLWIVGPDGVDGTIEDFFDASQDPPLGSLGTDGLW